MVTVDWLLLNNDNSVHAYYCNHSFGIFNSVNCFRKDMRLNSNLCEVIAMIHCMSCVLIKIISLEVASSYERLLVAGIVFLTESTSMCMHVCYLVFWGCQVEGQI